MAGMSAETKETMLFGQLQEGLRMELLRGPAVSGALGYKKLCVAAKMEEHWLAELRKRQGYQHQAKATSALKHPLPPPPPQTSAGVKLDQTPRSSRSNVTCHNCSKCGHIARDCWSQKSKSTPKKSGSSEGRGKVCRSSRRQAPKLNLRWW